MSAWTGYRRNQAGIPDGTLDTAHAAASLATDAAAWLPSITKPSGYKACSGSAPGSRPSRKWGGRFDQRLN